MDMIDLNAGFPRSDPTIGRIRTLPVVPRPRRDPETVVLPTLVDPTGNWKNSGLYDRNMLCAVKTGIYNPGLPTIRRMTLDDEVGKLSDEHCRTSTFIEKEDFLNPTIGWKPLVPYQTSRYEKPKDLVLDEYRDLNTKWRGFMALPEREQERISPSHNIHYKYTSKDYHLGKGMAVEVRRQIPTPKKYSLQQEWPIVKVRMPYRTMYNLFNGCYRPCWLGS